MKQFVFVWLLLYAVLIGLTLNNTRPYQGDESYYITSSIHMLQTGNFLAPVYFGNFRFQKPILPYWMTMLGYKIFGIRLWSGRIIFFGLAGGLLLLLYKFALLVVPDRQFALLNTLLLSSSTLFIEFSRVSMTDLPLTFFTTLALYNFYQALVSPDKLKRYYCLAFVSSGFACASKGFLGMLPVLVMLGYVLLVKPEPFKRYVLYLFHPLYLLVFAILAFSWYLYTALAYPHEFMQQVRIESAANVSSSLAPIVGHVLFYVRVIFTYYLPFTAIAAYAYLKKRYVFPKHFLLVILYIVLSFLLLVLIVKRHKDRYLLIAFPQITLLISYLISQHHLDALAKKMAVVWTFLQLAVFLWYPFIVGTPVQDLIAYWQQHLSGDLTAYELPEREISWAQALSHGMLQPYPTENGYVILDAKHLDHFKRYDVLQQAQLLQKIEFNNYTFTKRLRTFLLIKPLP
jgi:4-amino-4-deoxy-L-arabinose transferase-like glycosyltransferase